jgi:hypothetical protein
VDARSRVDIRAGVTFGASAGFAKRKGCAPARTRHAPMDRPLKRQEDRSLPGGTLFLGADRPRWSSPVKQFTRTARGLRPARHPRSRRAIVSCSRSPRPTATMSTAAEN